METSTDRFGNCWIKLLTPSTEEVFKKIESIKKEKKGVVIVGFDQKIIDDLNSKYYNNDIVFLNNNNDESYNLLVNGSNCPHFCDGQVFAAGMCIVVYFDGSYYGIFTKDLTKTILMPISDICTEKEYNTHGTDLMFIAMKKAFDETDGSVVMNDQIVQIDGLKLSDHRYPLISTEIFSSTYYEIKVRDHYYCYGCSINYNQTKSKFLKAVFDRSNQLPNGDFKLMYKDHAETEYIYAIKMIDLPPFIPDNLDHNMTQIKAMTPKLDFRCGISRVGMLNTYLLLGKIRGIPSMCLEHTIDDPIKMAEYGLPRHLLSLQFVY